MAVISITQWFSNRDVVVLARWVLPDRLDCVEPVSAELYQRGWSGLRFSAGAFSCRSSSGTWEPSSVPRTGMGSQTMYRWVKTNAFRAENAVRYHNVLRFFSMCHCFTVLCISRWPMLWIQMDERCMERLISPSLVPALWWIKRHRCVFEMNKYFFIL